MTNPFSVRPDAAKEARNRIDRILLGVEPDVCASERLKCWIDDFKGYFKADLSKVGLMRVRLYADDECVAVGFAIHLDQAIDRAVDSAVWASPREAQSERDAFLRERERFQ